MAMYGAFDIPRPGAVAVPESLKGFSLNERLEADTFLVTEFRLSSVRLMNDSRFPWVILVPRIAGAEEIFDLTRAQQTLLTEEVDGIARALSAICRPQKINIGALGNIVRQLHVHVIARFEHDEAWPGPVWGQGPAQAYTDEGAALIALLKSEISLATQRGE